MSSTFIMLVSFIIPAYNAASTIKRCLDSIYALPLDPKEFEVVLIDDCSKDNTIAIVEKYSYIHSNITLLRQQNNNRQGAARNRGVSVAKGEYVCFVDSDDAVANGIVVAIRLAKEKQTDMTAFHYVNSNEFGEITIEEEHLGFAQGQAFTGIEMQNKHPYWCSGPVAYVYSKEFLERVDYPFAEGVFYEDSDFVIVHLYYAGRMAYSPGLGYFAYYREGSTTRSMTHKNWADYLLLGTRLLAFHTIIQHDIEQGGKTNLGICRFAESVLEGACYNVTKALKCLYKLDNWLEIKAFYDRVDAHVDRRALSKDKRLYKYSNYWSGLASIGIKNKFFSIALNTCFSVVYKVVQKHKKQT